MNHSELIQELFDVRSKITEIKNQQLKDLEKRKKELEDELISALDELGVDNTSIKGIGTVGISELVVPQVKDWDKFYEYIRENNAFFMLNRAPNAASYREAINVEGEIPGVVPFTKRSLSVRKAA